MKNMPVSYTHLDVYKRQMHEIQDFDKKHRGKGQREDSEWEQIIEEASKIGKKYEGNAWCKQFLIQMISIIEEDDTEISCLLYTSKGTDSYEQTYGGKQYV